MEMMLEALRFSFGLSEAKLEALFLRAGILKPKGERLQYQRNIVDEMLSLDIHNTKGMEFAPCEITDESRKVTRKKLKKKTVYFLASRLEHICSRVGAVQEWSCPSETKCAPSTCKYLCYQDCFSWNVMQSQKF